MSIVTDILLSSGDLDKINIIKELIDHVKHLEETKHGLLESLEKYYSLCQNIDKYNYYKSKFLRNLDNIEKLKSEINLYLRSKENTNLDKILEEKKYLDETISSIELIIKIHSLIVVSNSQFEQKEYADISQSINLIKKLLEPTQPDLTLLKTHFVAKTNKIEEKLLAELNKIFNTNYQWEIKDENCKLTILDLKSISSVLLSLNNCHYLDEYAFKFSDKILKNIFEPIFCKQTEIFFEETFLRLEYFVGRSNQEISILKGVINFFEFHMQSDNEKLFFQKVGKFMSERLVDIFTHKLYKPVIIQSRNDLTKAVNDFREVHYLEKLCKDIKFINDDKKKLDYYNRDINELYIEERCKNILFNCKALIKVSMLKYCKSSDVEFNCKKIKLTDELEFKPCLISEMMRDLISNCYLLLNEAKIENVLYMKKYHQYILYIINLYLFTASTKHQKSIQTIPFVAALFYNDCMLLSYHIMLMKIMINENAGNEQLSLRNVVLDVKREGIKAIIGFISNKKIEILKYIHLEGFQNEDTFVEICFAFERMFVELKDLHQVWIEALPQTMAHKFIGVLLNAAMHKLNLFVMSLEEINQSDAIRLAKIINSLLSTSTGLLHPTPVAVVAPKWTRLNEIKFVITASNLNEIDDRWSNGNGPLAREFKTVELEALKGALFKNI